ncbi:hypothetical protein ACWGDE_02310 [Streptomyces sp. NPDC054956]
MTDGVGNDGAGGGQAGRDRQGVGKSTAAVPCPRCGATGTVLIGNALETSGCMHVGEGTVIALMAAAAGKYYADEKGWPWLTAVGAVVAVAIFVGTIWLVRDGNRTAARARAAVDRARAQGVEATRYCGACREAYTPEEPASS